MRLVVAVFLFACSPVGVSTMQNASAYDVDPVLVPAFEVAAWRLATAAGVGVYQDSDGTPIRAVEDIDGACGWTTVSRYAYSGRVEGAVIDVDVSPPEGCASQERVILHELIHSLRRGWPSGHTTSDVFAERGGDGKITEEALMAICEAVECTAFNPEE